MGIRGRERRLVRQSFIVALFQRAEGILKRTEMTRGDRAQSGVRAMPKEGQGSRKCPYVRTSAPNSSREVDSGHLMRL